MSGAVQDRLPVSESPWQQARKRFMQTRMGPAGLAVLIGIFIFVVLGSLLLPYDFYVVPQPDVINFVGRPPAWGRPFGETGMLQLDVLTLVANGGRTSLIPSPQSRARIDQRLALRPAALVNPLGDTAPSQSGG